MAGVPVKRDLQELADKYAVLYGREPAKLKPARYVPFRPSVRHGRSREPPSVVAVKDLPYEYFQSAILQCPLTFMASLCPALIMAQFVEAVGTGKKKLNSFASTAMGHSQGVASGACLTMGLHPAKVAVALMRQGQLQQELVGISHFTGDADSKRAQTSAMVGLRGPPHACLHKGVSTLPVALINDEANVVCSGELAPALLSQSHFKGIVKRTVRRNALAIPAPNHSRHLEPALMRLLSDSARYTVPLDEPDSEWVHVSGSDPGGDTVRVIPSNTEVREVRGARETWRSVCAQQMVLTADYPSSVVSASLLAESEMPTMLDFGPLPLSIAASLLKSARSRFTLTPSLVRSLEDEVEATDASRSLVVPAVELELQRAFRKARVQYGDKNFEKMAVQKDSGMRHTATDFSRLLNVSNRPRLPGGSLPLFR
mmetsp:Transcript_15852/g.28930  ORF Transcript_15852/g.28930 Transcript_15852/m.28930 type:complete len:428 (-) Transcript_15852:26-1309(-)